VRGLRRGPLCVPPGVFRGTLTLVGVLSGLGVSI
jgi:hypothetical protein